MICYKDKTFCAQENCAKAKTCRRILTDEDKKAIERENFLVSFCKFEECFEESEK